MNADSPLKIKICGMKYPDNIQDVAAIAPDFMGFIFYALSPRNAIGISPEILKKLPSNIIPVAVFVDEQTDMIVKTTRPLGITTIQLHGCESPEFCRSLLSRGYRVIKAFKIPSDPTEDFFEFLTPYVSCVDLFLFDSAGTNPGGNGIKFNWEILESYNLPIPFLLSGGIGPEDFDLFHRNIHPMCIGLDINSKFESAPGQKDITKLSEFKKLMK